MSPARWRLVLTRSRRWLVLLLGTRQVLRTRTKLLIAVSIFALSFATKSLHAVDLANLMYTTEQPFGGLTESYDRRAVSILAGEGLLGPYGIEPSNTQWITQAPGYSIFLSGVYSLFDRNFFDAQLVQNLLNSLSAVLMFMIAGSLISWRVGVLSGLLAALSHHLGHISNFILPDEMNALPVLAGIYLLMLARRRLGDSHWAYAAAGIAIGLASWLRAQTMLLAVFAWLMLAIISPKRMVAVRRGLLLAAFSILAISPITVRNYFVYGEFIPIQLGTGLNLWEGIADASGDRFGAVRADTEVASQEAALYNDPRYAGSWTTPDGIRRDRDRTRRSLDIILKHPAWYAGVMLGRCADMLKYSAHAPLVLKIDQASDRQRSAPMKRGWEGIASDDSSLAVGRSLFWLRPVVRPLQRAGKETMLSFIIIGAVSVFLMSWRRALFLLIVPLYYFVFQSAMHTEFRYTLPMQYFMFVFAATAWVLIGAAIVRVVKTMARNSYRSVARR
ncbi:MAG TPA: glycosyltransferase family 39 protein [Blastocatellia bacterium]|nr:glycosyltransferase family 39 protein [Blastocatellia bacterium]